jgi:hypothetical protein
MSVSNGLSQGRINNVLNKINSDVNACLDIDGVYYELAEITPNDRAQNSIHAWRNGEYFNINLDDSYNILCFYVANGFETEESESFQFGRQRAVTFLYDMTCYVAVSEPLYYEEVIHDFVQSMPQLIADTGFKFITLTVNNVENDQQEIFSELYSFDEPARHEFHFYLYKINFTLNLTICQ